MKGCNSAPVAERGRAAAGSFLAAAHLLAAAPAPLVAQSDVAFPAEVYAERRARLMDRIGAPVIVASD
jgi:hypothetical protein